MLFTVFIFILKHFWECRYLKMCYTKLHVLSSLRERSSFIQKHKQLCWCKVLAQSRWHAPLWIPTHSPLLEGQLKRDLCELFGIQVMKRMQGVKLKQNMWDGVYFCIYVHSYQLKTKCILQNKKHKFCLPSKQFRCKRSKPMAWYSHLLFFFLCIIIPAASLHKHGGFSDYAG